MTSNCAVYGIGFLACMCVIIVLAGGLTAAGLNEPGPNVNFELVPHGDTAWEQNANARADAALDAVISDELTAESSGTLACFGLVAFGLVWLFWASTRPLTDDGGE